MIDCFAIGFCDFCQTAPVFGSVEAREKWRQEHPCFQDADDQDADDEW